MRKSCVISFIHRIFNFSGKELINPNIGNLGALGIYDFGARHYDPMLGRWFNVDPALQFANPYSYCGNNPVMYIDPDGRLVWFAPLIPVLLAAGKAALIGAGASVLFYAGSVAFSDGGFNNWNWQNAENAALIGGVSGLVGGAAGFGVGKLFDVATGFFYGAAVGGSAGLTGGFTAGFMTSGMSGGSFSDMTKSGFKYAGIGALTGAALGGTMGGIDAARNGKDFWTGVAKTPPAPAPAPAASPNVAAGNSTPTPESQNPNVDGNNHSVYTGVNEQGEVKYVGRTGRAPEVRYTEHLKMVGTGKELLDYKTVQTGMNLPQARVLEQQLINQYGLGRDGGQLLNKINSIAADKMYKIRYTSPTDELVVQ